VHFFSDLTEESTIQSTVAGTHDIVSQLDARKAVNDENPRSQFRKNTETTYSLVEAVLDANIQEFSFTSTSTVYGEALHPTPEDYAPLEPISAYGASKLACEAILSTAAHSHNPQSTTIASPISSVRNFVVPASRISSKSSTMIQRDSQFLETAFKRNPACISKTASTQCYMFVSTPLVRYPPIISEPEQRPLPIELLISSPMKKCKP
jgi:nucleoside-diphosphate-sugar epimerase